MKEPEALAALREIVAIHRQREDIQRRKVRLDCSTEPSLKAKLELAQMNDTCRKRESKAWGHAIRLVTESGAGEVGAVSQNQLRRAIAAFVRAALEEDNRGTQDPDDWPAIERRMKRTHTRLDQMLRALPIPLNTPRKAK